MRVTILLLAILALVYAQQANPITIKGNKFYNTTTGQRWYFIGLDYAPSSSSPDPIADITSLTRDLQYFKQLGINCIRVYSLASNTDHTQGLNLLLQNGIYVIFDVSEPSFSISNVAPSWSLDIFSPIKTKITPLMKHPATIAFIAGNEVINSVNETIAAPYIKASIRDIKAYIAAQGYSTPVGYAATDNPDFNNALRQYLDCQSLNTSVDFYGLNTYRGCASDPYESSGFPELKADVGQFRAPYILTEYGCNQPRPRTFLSTNYIYDNSSDYLSGGLVYEYSEENGRNYGLVTIANGQVTPNGELTTLQNRIANITPQGGSINDPATTYPLDSCPATSPTSFLASTAALPPTPSESDCTCLDSQLTCKFISSATVAQIQSGVNYACTHQAGNTFCNNVASNSTSGVYGQYSGCTALQRANYIITAYVKSVSGASCNFDNTAQTVTATNNCGPNQTLNTGSSTNGNPTSNNGTPSSGSSSNNSGSNSGSGTNNATAGSASNGNTNGNNASNSASAIVPAMVAVFIGVMVL